MDIKEYNEKRDKLSALLTDVVSQLENIDSRYSQLDLSPLREAREKIAVINRRVYEDIFKIVLVARFQGGKSTSFNAITGGECYSPMGNGAIKCSASPVMAKNVLDSSQIGFKITMRTPQQMSALLSAAGLEFDIGSKQERQEALRVWEERFLAWKENPRTITSPDERDMMYVAGFILSFYDNPTVVDYVKRHEFVIEAKPLSKFARFPKNYTLRYQQSGPSAFDVDEILYAFVDRIDVSAQSEEMSKIGASFVDAPGLFANAYDTCVTTAELSDASAVWYLLGATQPGAEELKAIQECVKLCSGRIFFSANMINNLLSKTQWMEDVLPTINQHISQSVGEAVEVRPYHALLALLYIQGMYYLRHHDFPGQLSVQFLRDACVQKGVPNAAKMDVADCWRMMVKIAMRGLYPWGLEDFDKIGDPLSENGLAVIKRESNWDGTVDAIREFVISQKSKSVLITDSSQKALNLIDSLKALLHQREDEANKSFEEVQAAYVKAEATLEDFMKFMEDQITKQLDGTQGKIIDSALATDLYKDAFFGGAEDVAALAAPQIVEKTGLLTIASAKVVELSKKAWNKLKSFVTGENYTEVENSYAKAINTIMLSAYREVITCRTSTWMTTLKDGGNNVFQTSVINRAKTTFELLEHEWNQKCAKDELLSGLIPVCPQMPDTLMNGRFDSPEIMGFLTKMSFAEFVKDLIINMLGGLLWIAIPEPICATIAIIITFFVSMYRRLMRADEMVAELGAKIRSQMILDLTTGESNFVEQMSSRVSAFRDAVISVLRKPFQDVQDTFESAKQAAMNDYMRDKSHRDKVAADCKTIRETYLEGDGKLDVRLREYIKEVSPLCH